MPKAKTIRRVIGPKFVTKGAEKRLMEEKRRVAMEGLKVKKVKNAGRQ